MDDLALIAKCGACALPPLNFVRVRAFSRVGDMHHAVIGIGLQGFDCALGRQMARGIALPVHLLASDLGDFNAAVPFRNRTKRRAPFDGQ